MISAPEAERAVIGSMLIEKEAIASCIDILQPEAFHEAQNAAICRYIYNLFKAGRAVDPVAISEQAKLDPVSIPSLLPYLVKCMESVTTAAHASHHAKTVLDRFYARKILEAAGTLSSTQDEAALRVVTELVMRKEAIYSPPSFTYQNNAHSFIEFLDNRSKKKLYRTGFKSVDAAHYGWGTGELITVALATNVGKSVTLLNIMNNMSLRGVRCGYIGTEMSAEETMMRHASIISGVDAYKLRIGSLNLDDRRMILDAVGGKMVSLPVSMLDHPSPSLADVNSFVIAQGCKVVFLDYLERFEMPKAESYRLKIKEFMAGLKTLARRRDVVIVLAAQLGRQTYNQNSTKPTLADLSESKSIEQESDKVLLGYADPVKQPGGLDTVISFINAKNRQGKKGHEFDLLLDGKTLTMREREEASVER